MYELPQPPPVEPPSAGSSSAQRLQQLADAIKMSEFKPAHQPSTPSDEAAPSDPFAKYAGYVGYWRTLRLMFVRKENRRALRAYQKSLNFGQKVEVTLIRLFWALIITLAFVLLLLFVIFPILGHFIPGSWLGS